jgi:hypothetical protein
VGFEAFRHFLQVAREPVHIVGGAVLCHCETFPKFHQPAPPLSVIKSSVRLG